MTGRKVRKPSQSCFNGDPYPVIVREESGGEVKQLSKDDPRYGGVLTLFTTPKR